MEARAFSFLGRLIIVYFRYLVLVQAVGCFLRSLNSSFKSFSRMFSFIKGKMKSSSSASESNRSSNELFRLAAALEMPVFAAMVFLTVLAVLFFFMDSLLPRVFRVTRTLGVL